MVPHKVPPLDMKAPSLERERAEAAKLEEGISQETKALDLKNVFLSPSFS